MNEKRARSGRRSGFGAPSLMLTVAMIGLGAAFATPQFCAMSGDAKLTKGRQDCDTIAQAIAKFRALEGAPVTKLLDLQGKYLTNIDTLRDPWGNPYAFNAPLGVVYSPGADRASGTLAGLYNPFDPANADNPSVSGLGTIGLESAGFERTSPARSGGPVSSGRVYLRLAFTGPVRVLASALSLGNSPSTAAMPAPFAWQSLDGGRANGDPESPLAENDRVFEAFEPDTLHADASILSPGTFTHGRSYRELLFILRAEEAPRATAAALGLALRAELGKERCLSAVGLPRLGERRPDSVSRLGGGLVISVGVLRDQIESALYRESLATHRRGVTPILDPTAVALTRSVARAETAAGLPAGDSRAR